MHMANRKYTVFNLSLRLAIYDYLLSDKLLCSKYMVNSWLGIRYFEISVTTYFL